MQKWWIAIVVIVVVVAVVLFVNNSTSSGANATSFSVRAPAAPTPKTVDAAATPPARDKAATFKEGVGLKNAPSLDVETFFGQQNVDVDDFFSGTQ